MTWGGSEWCCTSGSKTSGNGGGVYCVDNEGFEESSGTDDDVGVDDFLWSFALNCQMELNVASRLHVSKPLS